LCGGEGVAAAAATMVRSGSDAEVIGGGVSDRRRHERAKAV